MLLLEEAEEEEEEEEGISYRFCAFINTITVTSHALQRKTPSPSGLPESFNHIDG